ncbi:MAG: hypothetical protein MMC33_000865 [Icmadophila ericetorum]|nr:hypothetical protein [Icmadophila ericetorum]
MSQQEEQGERYLSIQRLLDVAGTSEASDPKDYVYGLLGMMSPAVVDKIKPNYSLQLSDVFVQTARAFIVAEGNLELLREAHPWGKSEVSWAPDWTWKGRLRYRQPLKPYLASGADSSYMSFSADSLYLSCNGVIINEIDGPGARRSAIDRGGIMQWSYESVIQPKSSISAYGSLSATREALGRFLVGDQNRADSPVDHTWQPLFNLPWEMEDAMMKFKRLGWGRFLMVGHSYGDWGSWRQANNNFLIGSETLGSFFTNEFLENASEGDL